MSSVVIGCRVAVLRSHWSAVPTLLFIYKSQLLRDSFFVSQQPPIWEPPSHYSMHLPLLNIYLARFSLIYFAEKESAARWSFPDSFWWGLMVLTTVIMII